MFSDSAAEAEVPKAFPSAEMHLRQPFRLPSLLLVFCFLSFSLARKTMILCEISSVTLLTHRALPFASRKTNPLGEDSFYVSPKKDCIGVFDGVGGWSKEYGVDARAYSNKLTEGVKTAFEEKKMRDPIEMCHFAWEGAKEIPGTSTACVAYLEGTKLKVGNIGDSGTIILRKEKTFFRTKEQQVEFNMPYQIGTGSDLTPKTHGELSEVQLQHGDWIIMSSDGLFDNLEVSDMLKVLKKTTPENAAKDLADKTFKLSQDKHHHSPFAKDAKKNGLKWTGGKPDDITVIAAFVHDPNAAATSSTTSSASSSSKGDKGKKKGK